MGFAVLWVMIHMWQSVTIDAVQKQQQQQWSWGRWRTQLYKSYVTTEQCCLLGSFVLYILYYVVIIIIVSDGILYATPSVAVTVTVAGATTRNLIYICKDLLLDNTHVCFQLLFFVRSSLSVLHVVVFVVLVTCASTF